MKHLHIHIHLPAAGPDWSAISKQLDDIMTTQTEAVTALKAATDKLVAMDTKITKIGAETTSLLNKISELTTLLEDAGSLSPELESAIGALNAQVTAVEAALLVVDDKVPDVAP